MTTIPRLEINLEKIVHNVKALKTLFEAKGVSICAVTKVVCGNPTIARLLVNAGVSILADSKVQNLKKMRASGIQCELLLLGPPMFSQAESVIKYAHISLNTEISVIRELSKIALSHNLVHKVVLMVEYGDLREGIMPKDMEKTVEEVLELNGVELLGIGTNLACFGGIQPDNEKMKSLSAAAVSIEERFHIKLPVISGGSSANYHWFSTTRSVGRINNLRLGESIFLGLEPLNKEPIPGLFVDAFTLVAEVTELKMKPYTPYGTMGLNAFGEVPKVDEKEPGLRAILSIGLQDVPFTGLTPELEMLILGGSSDHMVVNPQNNAVAIGDEIRFNLNYPALLSAMTSPYISKVNLAYD